MTPYQVYIDTNIETLGISSPASSPHKYHCHLNSYESWFNLGYHNRPAKKGASVRIIIHKTGWAIFPAPSQGAH